MIGSKWFAWFAALFFIGCICYASYVWVGKDAVLTPSVIRNCFSDNHLDETCVRRLTDALLEREPASELMHYIVASSSPDLIRLNCHPVAHIIGEESYKRTNNMEESIQQCTDECNLGCWHGVIVASVIKEIGSETADDLAHADSTEIQKVGTTYCAQSREICHAVGHVVYANLGDIQRGLSACDRMATKERANACYQGVYMEAFQNSFTSTVQPSRYNSQADTLAHPCDTMAPKYQHTCFFYLPGAKKQHLLLQDTTYAQRVQAWHTACGGLPSQKMRSDCFLGFGLAYEAYLDPDGKIAKNYASQCYGLSGIERDSCLVGVALSYAVGSEYQSALSFCFLLTSDHEKTLCYDAAFQTHARFSENKTATIADCKPQPYPQECETALQSYIKRAATLPDYFAYGLFK